MRIFFRWRGNRAKSGENGASSMKIPVKIRAIGVLISVSACSGLNLSNIVDTSASDEVLRPPDAEPGACYGREVAPAVFETVVRQILVRAASYGQDGDLVTPAAYRTETTQKMLQDRENIWLKVPCGDDKVEEFDASVQRALRVRGLYGGKITGKMDARTRRAVRKYQQPLGLDSDQLSLASARKLGLVAVERDPKEE